MVGDRLLGEQKAVRAADSPPQPRRVERPGQRPRELRRIRDEGDVGVEPADDRLEVAGVHERGDGEEGEVWVGEPHERQRLACGNRVRAVAAVQDGTPAAALERAHEAVGAVGVFDLQTPAGLFHRERDRASVRNWHVHEQHTKRPVWPHLR